MKMLQIAAFVGLAAVGAIAFFIQNNLDAMGGRGGAVTKRRRARQDYSSVEEWLMSETQRSTCDFTLEGKTVKMKSSARETRWQVDEPPKMMSDGASHFNGILGRKWSDLLLPDIVVRPDAVKIRASREAVSGGYQ